MTIETGDPTTREAVHVEPGAGMTRALDWYLATGYDIESARDGWVLLRGPRGRLVLTVGRPRTS
ncbi:hypothetical protein [Amycolatopsis sp. BJA-103]|uniref:hypothetical protein n=1 Tax=Amycolatopsis sp. BJA-103 TaxID=1911175 RepID=UPI000C779EC9|nr:hypothetical protein [Amycolatopsis sp. BJA-103]AUI60317.1 hypothetical protein BKN51_20385 [Amycolatopsis sp. BJA-103]PNE16342.1 hypothetical protein B1H26_23995 [Amycolatopsis sp. BJA-103]